jgi:hypothetical protein
LALPPQALILQSGTDPLKVLLGVNPFDSFHTCRENADPTFSNSLDYFTLALMRLRAKTVPISLDLADNCIQSLAP